MISTKSLIKSDMEKYCTIIIELLVKKDNDKYIAIITKIIKC